MKEERHQDLEQLRFFVARFKDESATFYHCSSEIESTSHATSWSLNNVVAMVMFTKHHSFAERRLAGHAWVDTFFRPFKRCLCWPLIGIYSGYLAANSWSLKYLLPLQDYNFSQKWNGPTNTFLFVFHKHFAAADSSGWMFLNVQRHRCFQVLFRKSLPWNNTRLFIISSEATMVKNPGWFQILPPAPILVPFSQLEVWYLKFGVSHTFLRIFGEFHTFLDIFGVFHTFLYIFVVFHTFLHIFGVFHTSNPSCFRQ